MVKTKINEKSTIVRFLQVASHALHPGMQLESELTFTQTAISHKRQNILHIFSVVIQQIFLCYIFKIQLFFYKTIL